VPVINSFTATPSSFAYGGGGSTLSWSTTNASSVSIDHSIGSVATTGTTDVTVTSSITYNLTATGPGGTVFSSVTISVDPPPPLPTIDTFTATPAVFADGGGTTTLAWTTTGADSVSLDQGIGGKPVDGSVDVALSTTTVYTLSATNIAGTRTGTVTVTVLPPLPIINSFSASPDALPLNGGSVLLSWSTTNVTSVSIDNGVGIVATSGTTIAQVSESSTFNLTATGPGGTAFANTSVTVDSITSLTNQSVFEFQFYILSDASAITPNLYKYISDRYGFVLRNIRESSDLLNNALVHIAGIDNVEAKLDILDAFRDINRTIAQQDYSKLHSATERLNNHVLSRESIGDINDYLAGNRLKVVQEWADLCAEIGMVVDPINIES
jgi:hypothetical protein